MHSAVLIPIFGRPKLTAYKIYRTVDPLSLTHAWNPEDQPPATDGQIASEQPDQPQHPLLDVRLVGAQLKVVVNDEFASRKCS